MITAELNQLLKEKKIIDDTQIKTLNDEWKAVKTPITWEDFLLDKKAISEDQLLQAKSEELKVPVVNLTDQQIEPEILELVPEPIAHRHKVISFAKTKEGLSLAMVDPTDLQTREFIKKKTGLDTQVF